MLKARTGVYLLLPVIGIAAIFLATGGEAAAQTGRRQAVIPPVNFGKIDKPSVPEDITGAFSEKAPPIRLDNPYLKDTLVLQHQIGLLERLIERQTVISQIESAYSEIGLPFRPNPPPREICEQLPPSIACFRGYPELYGNKISDISMDLEELLPEISSQEQTGTPAAIPDSAPPPVLPSGVMQEEKTPEKYNWAEVSCAGNHCKAVLVEIENPAVRKTVTTGDTLSDGAVVSAISFDGVMLSRNGKATPLEPAKAPSRGGPSSPVLGGGIMPGGLPENNAPAQPPAPPSLPPSQTVPALPPGMPATGFPLISPPKENSPVSTGLPTP